MIQIGEGCSSLKRIHPNAFSYQSNTTRGLNILAKNVIPDKSSPNFFYDWVNSFENLDSLSYLSQIGTLEEKFGENSNNNLRELFIRIDAIQGSPFSNMKKIYNLAFAGGNLNFVSKNALKIKNSNKWFSIGFYQTKINSSSFENGVFTESSLKKAAVSLLLSVNQIAYLDEAVFVPLLTSNGTELKIYSEPLDCDDCRSAWICKSNKSEQIRKVIYNAKCVDGRDFTDCKTNFPKCK